MKDSKTPLPPTRPPIKYHNLNSSNELFKTKTTTQMNDDEDGVDTDVSIANKENVNTVVITID